MTAVNKKGRFDPLVLFRDILGDEHLLAADTAKDLVRVCRNPHAGDLVISGWFPGEEPVTFAFENGAHGGPGSQKTSGFVLIPETMDKTAGVLRPLDLRRRIYDLLGKREE